MTLIELFEEAREIFIEKADEHPIFAYLLIFLGSLFLLIVLYYFFISVVSAFHSLEAL